MAVNKPSALQRNSPKPSDSYVQSFARGLEVIRSFSTASAPTLSEVAKSNGLTRASARRVLLTLCSLGYVKSDGRQFALTPKILDLGFAYLSSLPIWHVAGPVMEELVDSIQESCSLSVLEGTDIVYVLRVPTRKIMAINLSTGSRLPAYCTAMGRVLLAGLPDEEIRQILAASHLRAHTRHTITDPKKLLDKIHQARRRGWSLVDEELADAYTSLSVPIFNAQGETIAAMNVGGPMNRAAASVMVKTLLPHLQRASERISTLIKSTARRSY